MTVEHFANDARPVPPVAARSALLLVSFALVLAACDAAPPPSPTSAFRPEVVGPATGVEPLPCGLSRVTLASGDHIDLVMSGSSLDNATPCPGSATAASRRLFGTNDAELDAEHVFFFGHDPGGRPWYGWAGATSGYECGTGGYPIIGGAFEEADAFHLPSGVVLAKSPRFERGDVTAPAVVRSDGWVCIDASGAVITLGAPSRI